MTIERYAVEVIQDGYILSLDDSRFDTPEEAVEHARLLAETRAESYGITSIPTSRGASYYVEVHGAHVEFAAVTVHGNV